MKDKIKAFVKKNERAIKIVGLTLTSAGIIASAIVASKNPESCGHDVKNVDDLTDDEWDHLIGMAQKMDEYVAERRALKSEKG